MHTKNPQRLTLENVSRLCQLTSFEMTNEEKEHFIDDFESILDFIYQIKDIDTSSIKEIKKIGNQCIFPRQDQVKQDIVEQELMQNVPNKNNGFIVLPKLR